VAGPAAAAASSAPAVLQTTIEYDEQGWLTTASLCTIAMGLVDDNAATTVAKQPIAGSGKDKAEIGHADAVVAAAAGSRSSTSQPRPRIRHIKALNEFVHSLQQKSQPQKDGPAVATPRNTKTGTSPPANPSREGASAIGSSTSCSGQAVTARCRGQRPNAKRQRQQQQHMPASKRHPPIYQLSQLAKQQKSQNPAARNGESLQTFVNQQQQQQAQPHQQQQQRSVRCSIDMCDSNVIKDGKEHLPQQRCCQWLTGAEGVQAAPAGASQPPEPGDIHNTANLVDALHQGQERGIAAGKHHIDAKRGRARS